MPSLFTALKQYLRDAAPGGVLSPEAEPIAQYGRNVRGNVQGLLDDPAAFAKSAVLDVVPQDRDVLLEAMMLKEFRGFCDGGPRLFTWPTDEYGPVTLAVQWKAFE